MRIMCRKALFIVLLSLTAQAHAFTWQDLWKTKDQQGKALMEKQQFQKANDTFLRPDWRATSAYRAGDYEQAAKLYPSIKNEDAYYNHGNTLAHMGKYEEAIKAYDKALAINPDNQDALHNRKILEELLKKDKEQQKQDQDKQDQDKQNQDKQNQDKQNQDKQDQDKQNQDKQNQDKQDQDKQDQDKQNQDKQNQDKQDQDKQDQDKQNQNKQNQDKQNHDKQNQDKQNQDKQNQQGKQNQNKTKPSKADAQAQREKDQAKEQWLRLIPDDPGGLLREKFLRDHLRRQRGWN